MNCKFRLLYFKNSRRTINNEYAQLITLKKDNGRISLAGKWFNGFPSLTFLNVSRLHASDPKHSQPTHSCAFSIIIGSIFTKLNGNKCQSNWSIKTPISSYSLLISSANSHEMKTIPNAQNTSNKGTINSNGSIDSLDLKNKNWKYYKLIIQ